MIQSPVRIAVLDSDTGFLRVLCKRLEGAGWQYRVLASPVPLDAMVAMRLNAVVVDLAVLGPQGWSYLEQLCTRLPSLGVVVCTGRSSVAALRRRLLLRGRAARRARSAVQTSAIVGTSAADRVAEPVGA